MATQAQPVDINNVKRWSEKEGSTEKFKRFKMFFDRIKAGRKS